MRLSSYCQDELIATIYYLLVVAGELVLEVAYTLLDVALALVRGALGLLSAVPGDTADALLDAALDLVAETLRAVLRAFIIGHDVLSFGEVPDDKAPG